MAGCNIVWTLIMAEANLVISAEHISVISMVPPLLHKRGTPQDSSPAADKSNYCDRVWTRESVLSPPMMKASSMSTAMNKTFRITNSNRMALTPFQAAEPPFGENSPKVLSGRFKTEYRP